MAVVFDEIVGSVEAAGAPAPADNGDMDQPESPEQPVRDLRRHLRRMKQRLCRLQAN